MLPAPRVNYISPTAATIDYLSIRLRLSLTNQTYFLYVWIGDRADWQFIKILGSEYCFNEAVDCVCKDLVKDMHLLTIIKTHISNSIKSYWGYV